METWPCRETRQPGTAPVCPVQFFHKLVYYFLQIFNRIIELLCLFCSLFVAAGPRGLGRDCIHEHGVNATIHIADASHNSLCGHASKPSSVATLQAFRARLYRSARSSTLLCVVLLLKIVVILFIHAESQQVKHIFSTCPSTL